MCLSKMADAQGAPVAKSGQGSEYLKAFHSTSVQEDQIMQEVLPTQVFYLDLEGI